LDGSEALGAVIIVGEKKRRGRRQNVTDRPSPTPQNPGGSRIGSSAAGYALASMEELGPGQGHAIQTRKWVTALRAARPDIHIEIRWPRPQRGGG